MATTAYYTTLDLNPFLIDKDTGAPLSGGYVQFWEDADRTVPKLVFQKQNIGADPVTGQPIYQFVPLPDPIIVSGVGTLQDADGNNVAVYYYPFDADGNVQLYYVAVFNYLGVEQFTREGWGFNSSDGGSESAGEIIGDNMISNPQFVEVNFVPALGMTVNYVGGGTLNLAIAPDWNLQVAYVGNGTIVIERTAIAGNQNLATNPPYVLEITPGQNISSLILQQLLPNNPGIWTPQNAGFAGYVGTNILLGPNTTATINYAPSVGAPTQLLADTNVSASYVEYTNTVQLPPSANTQTADVGFVNINIVLSTTKVSLLSSVQVLGLGANITGLSFSQDSVNRQIDHLFNYWKPRLDFKPIQSWCEGWNFPLNPGLNGITFAAPNIGANKSQYTLDQTIMFQSVNEGLATSVDPGTEGLLLTATNASQGAIIQYLESGEAKPMLLNRLSMAIAASTDQAGGLVATMSIFYTKVALPNVAAGTNNSLVATLDANGHPATFNNVWIEVPRSNYGNAQFTIEPTANANQNIYTFNGWDMQGATDLDNALYIAIVVGFATLGAGNTLTVQAISCCTGDIPTLPGPESPPTTKLSLNRYFQSSFGPDVTPASNLGVNSGELTFITAVTGATTYSPSFRFPINMRTAPNITLFNPAAAGAQAYDEVANASATSTVSGNVNNNGFSVSCTPPGGGAVGNPLGIHFTADARLGIT